MHAHISVDRRNTVLQRRRSFVPQVS